MRTHRWNRLVWQKIVLSEPRGVVCPNCYNRTTGSVVFKHRWHGSGTVYLLPCWHNISPEEGNAIMAQEKRNKGEQP
jgi:hypothetical protein